MMKLTVIRIVWVVVVLQEYISIIQEILKIKNIMMVILLSEFGVWLHIVIKLHQNSRFIMESMVNKLMRTWIRILMENL